MSDIEARLAAALHSGVLMKAIAPGDTIKTNTPGVSVDGAEVRRRLVAGMLAADPTLAADLALAAAIREWVEYDGSISRHIDIEGGIGPVRVELFDSNTGTHHGTGATLTAAIEEALREANDHECGFECSDTIAEAPPGPGR